jgi:hypothetical protein
MSTFTITEDHLKLLRRACIGWCDDETGAPQIDPKRPYGNSFVEGDIADILGWSFDEDLSEEQFEKASLLHSETSTVLQIILNILPDLTGTYIRVNDYLDKWVRAK